MKESRMRRFVRTAKLLWVCIVLCHLSAPSSAADSEEGNGELILYPPRQSSIGIVARRVFRNAEGRITKTIYYGARPDAAHKRKGPFTEEMLTVQSIVLHAYDEQGHETRQEHYGSDEKLRRVREASYDADGKWRVVVWKNAAGVRTYEMRFLKGRKICDLCFDDSGEGLVGIRGALPEDIDLVHGWGKDMHGLSCGLAADRSSGTLAEIHIRATVRNRGTVADEITSGCRIILLDADGQVVPRKGKRADGRREDEAQLQTVKPRRAREVVHGELARWYGDVAPGDYALIVVCRDSEGDYSIVSNQLSLRILPNEG